MPEGDPDHALCLRHRGGRHPQHPAQEPARPLRQRGQGAVPLLHCLAHLHRVLQVQTIEGVAARHGPAASPPSEPIDLVVVREQTEGEYSCLEHMSVPGVVESYKVVTAAKSLRSD